MGCVGGETNQAFQYVKDNGGIDTEDSYPYEDDDKQCRFKAANVGANVTGFTDIKSKDESALQQAVATIGPISVVVDSSHTSFQLYKQGGMYFLFCHEFFNHFKLIHLVYHEIFCSQIHLDLAVLAVGYGTDSGTDYWLVKNR
jgi:cathepsin L